MYILSDSTDFFGFMLQYRINWDSGSTLFILILFLFKYQTKVFKG